MIRLAEPIQSTQGRMWFRFADPMVAALPPDECTVDFDRYMIIYGNPSDLKGTELPRFSLIIALMLGCNTVELDDPLSNSGATTIGCYNGNQLVGTISFYSKADGHVENGIDLMGQVHLWFPLSCFQHVVTILGREKKLSLSLVCDLDGKPFTHPIGTLLTWPGAIGGE